MIKRASHSRDTPLLTVREKKANKIKEMIVILNFELITILLSLEP
jgi:hypothetical protein